MERRGVSVRLEGRAQGPCALRPEAAGRPVRAAWCTNTDVAVPARCSVQSVDFEDDLACGVAVLQEPMSLRRLVEREATGDVDPQVSFVDQVG